MNHEYLEFDTKQKAIDRSKEEAKRRGSANKNDGTQYWWHITENGKNWACAVPDHEGLTQTEIDALMSESQANEKGYKVKNATEK